MPEQIADHLLRHGGALHVLVDDLGAAPAGRLDTGDGQLGGHTEAELIKRVGRVRSEGRFGLRILARAIAVQKQYPAPVHVEDRRAPASQL